MAPADKHPSPFLNRIYELTRRWIQEEWASIEALKLEAQRAGSGKHLKAAIKEAGLSTETLATRLDNISQAKLRRELKSYGAPTPGEIIHAARVEFAKHLLTHTRLLVRDVAMRAGYADERFFWCSSRPGGSIPRLPPLPSQETSETMSGQACPILPRPVDPLRALASRPHLYLLRIYEVQPKHFNCAAKSLNWSP